MPSSRIFAPSLIIGKISRSTISFLSIWRRAMPSRFEAAAMISSTSGSGIGEREHVGRRFPAANDFEQFHHVGGAEEMRAEYFLRSLRRLRDLVDIEVGRVGRKHGVRLRELVECAEHLFFDLHLLEYGLDHDIG